MDIHAIIFDWDGVIADTMLSIAGGIQEVAASYGVHLPRETIAAAYFQPRQAFYKSIGVDPDDTGELDRRHREAIARHYAGKVYPEAASVLSELKRRAVPLAVATQNEVPDIMREIDRLGLADFFAPDHVAGGPGTKEDKLRRLIAKLAVDPEHVLFVGDLPSDIAAAKQVGVVSVGINRDEAGRKRLAAEHPDMLITSLTALPGVLNVA